MLKDLKDPRSVASLCLVPYALSQSVGQGTGFALKVDDVLLLVSNYHVLSGRHPETGQQLPGVPAIPDRVLIPLLRRDVSLAWSAHVQMLLDNDTPLWVEHPQHGRNFDVVALPLRLPPHAHVIPYPIDEGSRLSVDLGSDVMIVGFPEGVSAAGLTAIWKSGTIASEPKLSVREGNFFYVDSNTRKGMSGAPVFARRFGSARMETGDYSIGTQISDRQLGVYSGRATNAPDMTLGRVWNWDGVRELALHAVSQVQRGRLSARPCTIGVHYPQGEVMVTLDANVSVQIQTVLGGGAPGPIISKSVADVVVELTSTDQRFGLSLARVKMAAQMQAAAKNPDQASGSFQLEDAQYALLREAIEAPSAPFVPAIAIQMIPLFDHILGAGQQPPVQ